MNCHHMSWTIGKGIRSNGGNKKNSTWDDVNSILVQLCGRSGTLTLDYADAKEIGPQSLQVRAENGMYLLTLGQHTEDDYEVRTYSNPAPRVSNVEILGDMWSAELICEEFSTVERIVREFYESADVPRALLS